MRAAQDCPVRQFLRRLWLPRSVEWQFPVRVRVFARGMREAELQIFFRPLPEMPYCLPETMHRSLPNLTVEIISADGRGCFAVDVVHSALLATHFVIPLPMPVQRDAVCGRDCCEGFTDGMIPKRRIGNEPLDIVAKAQHSVDLDFDETVQRPSQWSGCRIGKGHRETLRHPRKATLHGQVGNGESTVSAFELRQQRRQDWGHHIECARAVERAIFVAATEVKVERFATSGHSRKKQEPKRGAGPSGYCMMSRAPYFGRPGEVTSAP
jgi:hypothetical protein